MAFRPIPPLPPGISIQLSRSTWKYYYFDSRNGASLFLNAAPHIMPAGWRLINLATGGGAGAPPEYVGPEGETLPFYNRNEEYNLAIQDAIERGIIIAPLTGVKRGRNNNNTHARPGGISRRNGTINVVQARSAPVPIDWTVRCSENPRDPRHVTALIHNTEANTFLIGNENIYAKSGSQEIGLIRFTEFMDGDRLNLYQYINQVRSVLTAIGIRVDILNRPDVFPTQSGINTMVAVNEALINDILNRIGICINLSNNIGNYHVKKVQKEHLECSELIIMERRTYGRYLGFPKGAIEQVDIVTGNEDRTIQKAAIREVREEVRYNFEGFPPVILGTITTGERSSNVCYFAVNNALANDIITSFNARQITSELFNVQFVDCNYLSTNFRNFNGFSQQIINDLTGTESIEFRPTVGEIQTRLRGLCPHGQRGGRRKRHTRKSTSSKKRNKRTRNKK
jgi:ADP-ribose pyrophosphatase YjhB (NUDIX family)